MAKYLKTKEGSLEQAVLEAVKNSPAQIAAIASNKKQSENNYIHAARMASAVRIMMLKKHLILKQIRTTSLMTAKVWTQFNPKQ